MAAWDGGAGAESAAPRGSPQRLLGAGPAQGARKAGSGPLSCVHDFSTTCFLLLSLRPVFVAIVRGHSSDSECLLLFDRSLNKNKGRTVLHSPRENPSLSSVFASHPVKTDALRKKCTQDGTL